MPNVNKFKELIGKKYFMTLDPLGYLTTRIPNLDYQIGRPGIPLSKLTTITGVEASGKTTIALQLVAQAQAQGGIGIYIDTEYKVDPDYAQVLGVNMDEMILTQPEYMEKAFKIVAKATTAATEFPGIGPDSPVVIVVDSINALISKAEFTGDWEASHVAPQARAMSKLLPKVLQFIKCLPISLVFINQVRTAIGQISYTNDWAGGWAPKFHSTLAIKFSRIRDGMIRKNNEDIGNTIKAKVIKNQVGPPFRTCEFDIIWGKGVDYWKSMFDLAIELGIMKIVGLSYSIQWKGKEKKWGKRQEGWAEKNPEIADYISKEIDKRIRA